MRASTAKGACCCADTASRVERSCGERGDRMHNISASMEQRMGVGRTAFRLLLHVAGSRGRCMRTAAESRGTVVSGGAQAGCGGQATTVGACSDRCALQRCVHHAASRASAPVCAVAGSGQFQRHNQSLSPVGRQSLLYLCVRCRYILCSCSVRKAISAKRCFVPRLAAHSASAASAHHGECAAMRRSGGGEQQQAAANRRSALCEQSEQPLRSGQRLFCIDRR